ncbi:MAG TPA: Uma2 family endonuclease [Pyrinomonadaceae bacterium]|nr:Uma2 family endonuclease [Pyrinomonadaceae bacterium]
MSWVSTSPLVKTYTLEEFWELPEPPDHSKLELIAGVLYMTPTPGYLHNNAVSRLIILLADYVLKSGNKGKLFVPRAGIIKGPNSWLEPDLFYVAQDTDAYADPEYPRYMSTADLVIEVISPGSAIYDRNTKADTYAALGVKELWLVDEASGIIEVRVLEGDRYASSLVFERDDVLKSTVLSGFEMKVGDVFDG